MTQPQRPLGTSRLRTLTASTPGLIGVIVLLLTGLACIGTLPWTLASETSQAGGRPSPRYDLQDKDARHIPPSWWSPSPTDTETLGRMKVLGERDASAAGGKAPRWFLGTDLLGRSMLLRCLAGGGISLLIGLAAAVIAVSVGVAYGLCAGFVGGRVDAVMMRIVDVLYGLPYILLVVLIAVASDAALQEFIGRHHARTRWINEQAQVEAVRRGLDADRAEHILADDPALRQRLMDEAAGRAELKPRELSARSRMGIDLLTLLAAIGGVSWLTMARVVRGQVLSLKAQPFVEAARAIGASRRRIALKHILPNLIGPIIVYGTLIVPQAILQESFLSFLGIGVKPPLPSWGNLAAEGLSELNPYKSNWWLLVFPCGLLAVTLLALNFVGEGLREALDPKRAKA